MHVQTLAVALGVGYVEIFLHLIAVLLNIGFGALALGCAWCLLRDSTRFDIDSCDTVAGRGLLRSLDLTIRTRFYSAIRIFATTLQIALGFASWRATEIALASTEVPLHTLLLVTMLYLLLLASRAMHIALANLCKSLGLWSGIANYNRWDWTTGVCIASLLEVVQWSWQYLK